MNEGEEGGGGFLARRFCATAIRSRERKPAAWKSFIGSAKPSSPISATKAPASNAAALLIARSLADVHVL
jgi:hypothetical protein